MMVWQSGSYLDKHNNYFSKYKKSFILKQDELRYIPKNIKAPKSQKPENSYNIRSLNTGVAGIKYNI
jgi:hypothetical protein